MHLTTKQSELAHRVALSLVTSGYREGQRITEQQLTDTFRVSRSPIRAVMKFLAAKGFLEQKDKGYFIPSSMPNRDAVENLIPKSSDHELYEKIAQSRARDDLPEQFFETDLMRIYSVSRTQLLRVLNRLSLDGVVEPSTGRGWQFLPTLNKESAFLDSYRFRMIVEPAGILEPTFRIDIEALQKLRSDQVLLTDCPDSQKLIEQNATFHNTLAELSQNSFIIEAVHRHSRLRRLSEHFSQNHIRTRIRVDEHVSIIDALLDGQKEWAASLLRHHLEIASTIKPSLGI